MIDIRVFIIADDPLARAGLAQLLNEQPGCLVVGQMAGDETSLTALDIYHPDVILWDLGWEPTLNISTLSSEQETSDEGESLLNNLAEMEIPIVALLPDESYVSQVWGVGICALLLRTSKAKQLWAALQAAIQGLVVVDTLFTQNLFPSASGEASLSLVEALTPRELEVLQHLAEGLANKAIARRLDISEHTIKFHVNAIMSKLNAQSRTEAVVRATRLGLILL